MIIIEQMENSEIQQDFTGGTETVLIKSDEVLIKSSDVSVPTNSKDLVHPQVSQPEKRKRGRPKKEPEPQLSPFEMAFVNAYLDPGCGYSTKKAVMKAGHPELGSTDLGIKLMEDKRILQMIELRRRTLETTIATSREDVLRRIDAFTAIAMAKQDCTGAARLLSLTISMLGYNEPIQHNHTGSINLSFGSGEIIIGSKNPDRFSEAQDTEVTDEIKNVDENNFKDDE